MTKSGHTEAQMIAALETDQVDLLDSGRTD